MRQFSGMMQQYPSLLQGVFHRLILEYFPKEIRTVMLILQLEKYWLFVCERGREGEKEKEEKKKKREGEV